jgi:hypothetical protein
VPWPKKPYTSNRYVMRNRLQVESVTLDMGCEDMTIYIYDYDLTSCGLSTNGKSDLSYVVIGVSTFEVDCREETRISVCIGLSAIRTCFEGLSSLLCGACQ